MCLPPAALKLLGKDRKDQSAQQETLGSLIEGDGRHVLGPLHQGAVAGQKQHKGAKQHHAAKLYAPDKYVPGGVAHTQHPPQNFAKDQ